MSCDIFLFVLVWFRKGKISSKPKCSNSNHDNHALARYGTTGPSVSAPWLCHGKLLAVCPQSHSQPIMHSAAGYGSWFCPKMCNSSAVEVNRGNTDHIHTTEEPNQISFVTGPCSPLQTKICAIVLVCWRVQLLCSHRPKQTAPRGKTNQSLFQPN